MRVITSRKFDKQYKKQPRNVQRAFAKRINLFMQGKHNPLLKVHKLTGRYTGLWSFNVTADVRVIFDESLEEDLVLLVAIGTHSELYE